MKMRFLIEPHGCIHNKIGKCARGHFGHVDKEANDKTECDKQNLESE